MWMHPFYFTYCCLDADVSARPMIPRFAGLSILRSVYNWPSNSSSAELLVEQAQDLAEKIVTSAVPGAYLVELVPPMKYLPTWVAGWKRKVMAWHNKYSEILDGLREDVAASLVWSHSLLRLCTSPEPLPLSVQDRNGNPSSLDSWRANRATDYRTRSLLG